MNRQPRVQNSESGIQNLKLSASSQFERNGFQVVNPVISHRECNILTTELTPLYEQQQKSAKNKIGGVRNLLRTSAAVEKLAGSQPIIFVLESIINRRPFPVRAIFFDKNPDSNWLVPWHQDLAIAVAGHVENPTFSGWSIKDGVPHVHPPPEILEGMITLRLHLDDCSAENGALKIIPGSHQQGKLNAAAIAQLTQASQPVVCEVPKGGALLMRPLLLHASSPATHPSHRRVLHIEYATQELPHGLNWYKN